MLEFITRMFKRGNPGRDLPLAPMGPQANNPKLRRLDELSKLEDALRSIIQIAPDRIAGRLFVLSLDGVRSRFGNAWTYMGQKANRTASETIREQLTEADIMVPVGPIDFILMIGSGLKKDAAVRAIKLDQSMILAVTGEDLGPLSLTVREVLHDDKEDALRFRQLSFLDLQRAGAQQDGPSAINLESELALDDDEDAGVPSPAALIDRIRFVPQPVVDLASGSLVMRYLASQSDQSDGGLDDLTFLDDFDDPKLRAKLDLRCQRAMRTELRAMYARKITLPMISSVSFETLANAYTRSLYLKLAQRVPNPMRRGVVYEITAIPAGVALGRLIEISGIVRPFCFATMLRLDAGFKSFAGMQETGAMAIAPDCSLDAGEEMEVFCRSAKANRLKLYAGGIDTPDMTVLARDLGVDYGFGLAVPEPAEKAAAGS